MSTFLVCLSSIVDHVRLQVDIVVVNIRPWSKPETREWNVLYHRCEHSWSELLIYLGPLRSLRDDADLEDATV